MACTFWGSSVNVRALSFGNVVVLGTHGGSPRAALLSTAAIVAALAAAGNAQVVISESLRVGAIPSYEGSGWIGEAFLDIPDESALHLLTAENYVRDRTPENGGGPARYYRLDPAPGVDPGAGLQIPAGFLKVDFNLRVDRKGIE